MATGGIDLRFPGQWFQAESGLHQNWMRDYDPTTGRYIQADPLGLVDGASVYGYARQNPGRYVDPRGEESRTGPMSVPVPMWPGETYPGELGQSMLDINPVYLLIKAIVEMCLSEEDRCAQVIEDCKEICLKEHGPGPERFPRFRRCVRKCAEASGCYNY